MASPPPPYGQNYGSAISPPYPSNSQLPQPLKRRQSDMPSSAPTIKRRKASMLSTTSASSAHPLRQTSFPPENAGNSIAYSRSPSMDTMSMASGMAPSSVKKKKPRKTKGKDNDEESMAGGRGTSASAAGKRRASREHTADASDDGADEPTTLEASAERKAERLLREKRQRVIANHFDDDQFRRYEAWRAIKLPAATVRRIVNQTLSQSVPLPVIVAVQAAAKIFAGDMIEGARKVQSQWLEATGESQTGLPSPPAEGDGPTQKELRRGPLHPDHLREALRRHMLENHGGLVGELGLWQAQSHSGVERFGTKVGGKRLLK
ncbi:TAFII28-domain-containing protein [Stipitochalara longipes BDJ]|nr:TAFII28-domain-containing protein [Stipitochalara longipes BDJ]